MNIRDAVVGFFQDVTEVPFGYIDAAELRMAGYARKNQELRNTLRSSIRRTATELKAMEEMANNLHKKRNRKDFFDKSMGELMEDLTKNLQLQISKKVDEPYTEFIYVDPNDEDKMNEFNAQGFKAVSDSYCLGTIQMVREVKGAKQG